MRFRAKCVEPSQMIALSRISGAFHKLTKSIVMILRKDHISFVMPTSVATFSNASSTSRCISALDTELDANQMFSDYSVEFNLPDDDGIYMHLDTEHLARAFTLKSSTDRSLSFVIKLAKMGDKPCIVVRREQLSSAMPDAGADAPDAGLPGATSNGLSSFFLDHKLGLEWVARRHWSSYKEIPAGIIKNLPPSGIGMPNDLRHIKTVIDRFSALSKDGKTVAKLRIDPRRHLLSFRIDSLSFDAEAEFTDLPVFNCSDYNQMSQPQFPLAASSNNQSAQRNSEFEALVDLRRLGEALTALDKITQQSFVPATLALLGLTNRRGIVLVAIIDVGVQVLAVINTIAPQDEEEDFEEGEIERNPPPARRSNNQQQQQPRRPASQNSDEADTENDEDDN